MLVYSGKNELQCHVCLKEFAYKYHLKRHMVTHTKEKASNVMYVTKVLLKKVM